MREKVVTRIEPNVTIIPKLEPLVRHKRVAAYVRVSTASDEQMGSIAAQRDYYSKYIAGNTQSTIFSRTQKYGRNLFFD